MKKSTVLSFLTAAAIVTTTAGTYSAWDSIEATTSETVTFRKPVTVKVDADYTLDVSEATLNSVPTASGEVNFTVSNEGGLADTLTITPVITGGSLDASHFDIEILDKNASSAPLDGDTSDGFTDKSLDSTVYTVNVTPKDEHKDIIGGEAVQIQLTATLSKAEQ